MQELLWNCGADGKVGNETLTALKRMQNRQTLRKTASAVRKMAVDHDEALKPFGSPTTEEPLIQPEKVLLPAGTADIRTGNDTVTADHRREEQYNR